LVVLVVSFFRSSFKLLPKAKSMKHSIQLTNLLVGCKKQKQLVGGVRQDLLKLVATPRNWPLVALFGQRILDVAQRHRGDGATRSVGGWENKRKVWEARAGAGGAGTLHLGEL
jgi:hypothetical protein